MEGARACRGGASGHLTIPPLWVTRQEAGTPTPDHTERGPPTDHIERDPPPRITQREPPPWITQREEPPHTDHMERDLPLPQITRKETPRPGSHGERWLQRNCCYRPCWEASTACSSALRVVCGGEQRVHGGAPREDPGTYLPPREGTRAAFLDVSCGIS